ncbi:MAG TPA: GYDIA family GHMP kinase [Pricia sp.]|nr:GYDIA family GHMP kinase [Pricia sp.]
MRLKKTFYSNGKLLLTGEYAVLDGALSLAVPTRYGQSLSVKSAETSQLIWKSLDENGQIWFETVFDLKSFSVAVGFNDVERNAENEATETTLLALLRGAQKLNPAFLKDARGYHVETRLTFPRNWGLGSSSTLINNIAQWAEIDAYHLLWNVYSGSGYDIACAQHDRPILYRLSENPHRTRQMLHEEPQPGVTQHPEKGNANSLRAVRVEEVAFDPPFSDNLHFVHLNKKQDSQEGIATYRKKDGDRRQLVQKISEITRKTVACKSLTEFEALAVEHETLLSQMLQRPTVGELLFPDFGGVVKSLGAWGGDFVLATGDAKTPSYFKEKGYPTVVAYSDMVLTAADDIIEKP